MSTLINEKIDIASENDIAAYRDACNKFTLQTQSLIKLLIASLPTFTGDEYIIIYTYLVNIQFNLLGIEQDPGRVDYIGLEPCIDTLYTLMNCILYIILSYNQRVSNTRSLKLIKSICDDMRNAMAQMQKMEATINGIIQNQSLAKALASSGNTKSKS